MPYCKKSEILCKRSAERGAAADRFLYFLRDVGALAAGFRGAPPGAQGPSSARRQIRARGGCGPPGSSHAEPEWDAAPGRDGEGGRAEAARGARPGAAAAGPPGPGSASRAPGAPLGTESPGPGVQEAHRAPAHRRAEAASGAGCAPMGARAGPRSPTGAGAAPLVPAGAPPAPEARSLCLRLHGAGWGAPSASGAAAARSPGSSRQPVPPSGPSRRFPAPRPQAALEPAAYPGFTAPCAEVRLDKNLKMLSRWMWNLVEENYKNLLIYMKDF